ncbi:MAG: TlpA family protein disulfide reductase [Bacteroidetes bacterium]|nr:TlpA family protein disulfide reductase [Bacteroidota bacterium]
MKRLILIAIAALMITGIMAQEKEARSRKLPSVDVKTTDGKSFNTQDISNDGKPIIVSFWALWCKPCIKELNTIADVYEDWQEETGVKLYAVSIDDARSSSKVLPFASGNSWEYEILLDPNGDFKRAMGVNMIPHTFLLDGEGNIVWQHTSFAEGAELELIDTVRKVAKGESVESH